MIYTKSKFSVRLLGTATVSVQNPRNIMAYSLQFVVVEDGFTPLLGTEAKQKMDLAVGQHQKIILMHTCH